MSSVIYYPGYSQVQVRENLIVRTIASITNSYPMIVTTTEPHQYNAGMDVTFLIPNRFGMTELNGVNAHVLQASGSTLVIDLDSTQFSIFDYPSPLPSSYTPPSIIPNASGPYIPPDPLPYGNQDSFEGTIYNGGLS